MRSRNSAIVFSSSFQFGPSTPARRAVVLLAKSQAICTWRLSANMSGARRKESSTAASNFLAAACACAFASDADRALRVCTKGSTAAWYMEMLMGSFAFCATLPMACYRWHVSDGKSGLGARQVVGILQVAQADTPFDRPIVEPEGRAIDPEQRRAGAQMQEARGFRVRGDGREPIFRAHQQNAVGLLKQIIEGVGQGFILRQIREQLLRQRDGLADEGCALARADAANANDLGPRGKLQSHPLGGACRRHRAGGLVTIGRDQLPGGVENIEKAKQHVGRCVLDDEGAAPLLAHDQTLRRQGADGLARGALADAKVRRDLEFTGDQLARPPNPRANPLDQLLADLGVERAGIRAIGGAHLGNTCCHATKSYTSLWS